MWLVCLGRVKYFGMYIFIKIYINNEYCVYVGDKYLLRSKIKKLVVFMLYERLFVN